MDGPGPTSARSGDADGPPSAPDPVGDARFLRRPSARTTREGRLDSEIGRPLAPWPARRAGRSRLHRDPLGPPLPRPPAGRQAVAGFFDESAHGGVIPESGRRDTGLGTI